MATMQKYSKTCPDCAHCKMNLAAAQAQMVCRRYPPTAAAIPVPTHSGISVQVVTLWPPVTANDHCAEFEVQRVIQ